MEPTNKYNTNPIKNTFILNAVRNNLTHEVCKSLKGRLRSILKLKLGLISQIQSISMATNNFLKYYIFN